jgi:NAD(P)-dependent dehydrogenase (short-subunit alcohol dehydrogenase family)
MAHVRAVRELLPGWLARGRGHFLATVSAAGLSTNLGAAPYAVSKHGALAFAEWLAATYGYRGITVQCLCPQAVRTPMYDNSPAIGKATIPGEVLEPGDVAELVAEALADHRFLILPHPEITRYSLRRATDPDRWLQQLSKGQRKLDEAIAALSDADHADGR